MRRRYAVRGWSRQEVEPRLDELVELLWFWWWPSSSLSGRSGRSGGRARPRQVPIWGPGLLSRPAASHACLERLLERMWSEEVGGFGCRCSGRWDGRRRGSVVLQQVRKSSISAVRGREVVVEHTPPATGRAGPFGRSDCRRVVLLLRLAYHREREPREPDGTVRAAGHHPHRERTTGPAV